MFWRIALIVALAWLWWSAPRNTDIEGNNGAGPQMVTEKSARSTLATGVGGYSTTAGTTTFATSGTMPVCLGTTTASSVNGVRFMNCSNAGTTTITRQ